MKQTAIKELIITSSAFKHSEFIPSEYTCEGENISPSLKIDGMPSGTISLAIVVIDPDAPKGTFTHWLVWNIPPQNVIEENRLPGGIQGLNDAGTYSYYGPCPPSGTHRYFFKVYALDDRLDLEIDSRRDLVEMAVQEHLVGYGELVGLYQKK